MNPAQWVGAGMAVAGLLLVVIELILIIPRAIRLTNRLKQLNLLFEDSLRLTHHELQSLSETRVETQALLRPYRQIARWLGHPITLALLASYRRRRAARRSVSPAH